MENTETKSISTIAYLVPSKQNAPVIHIEEDFLQFTNKNNIDRGNSLNDLGKFLQENPNDKFLAKFSIKDGELVLDGCDSLLINNEETHEKDIKTD